MQKSLCLSALLLITTLAPVSASTPDGQTPSRETVCDAQTGAAYGLCTAYCEAMDCDSPTPHASPTACSRVGDHFTRIAGAPVPCLVSCPCTGQIGLFAAFLSGSQPISVCVSGNGMTNVAGPNGDFVSVSPGTPSTCSANGLEPIIELTDAEANVCRDLLRQAAAAAGVACNEPE